MELNLLQYMRQQIDLDVGSGEIFDEICKQFAEGIVYGVDGDDAVMALMGQFTMMYSLHIDEALAKMEGGLQ